MSNYDYARASHKISMQAPMPNGTLSTLATGTAFFWENDLPDNASEIYLITNWHNVTGAKGWRCSLDKSGCSPEFVTSHIALSNGAKTDLRIELINQTTGDLCWLTHPNHNISATQNSLIDVVAIKVMMDDLNNETISEIEQISVNKLPEAQNVIGDTSMMPYVGAEGFLLGFPVGLDDSRGQPIWKRATIATNANQNHSNYPRFLVDSASLSGMSGSPMILRSEVDL